MLKLVSLIFLTILFYTCTHTAHEQKDITVRIVYKEYEPEHISYAKVNYPDEQVRFVTAKHTDGEDFIFRILIESNGEFNADILYVPQMVYKNVCFGQIVHIPENNYYKWQIDDNNSITY